MKSLSILLLTSCLLVTSCQKQNLNGNYLVYKSLNVFNAITLVDHIADTRDDVEQQLKSSFMGKQFNVEFTEDYILISCQGSKKYNDIVLNKEVSYEGIVSYYGVRMVGETKVKFRAMVNSTPYLTMAVDIMIPNNAPIIIPVQEGLLFRGQNDDKPQNGRIICCLKKID